MYSVSSKYKQDMKSPLQQFGVQGLIGLIPFTENNVLTGTLSVTNQCVDNDELLLGACYIGEFRATFINVPINRYRWAGQKITVRHKRCFPDGTYEIVPLGIYTITEAEWTAEGVSVVAYDNMSLLDKKATFDATSGHAYNILTGICIACGLELGMTQAQVEALPNGTREFGLFADNDIETFRDMIGWLAQALSSFVTIDRLGKVVLKSYNMAAVDTIDSDDRFQGASFSDYITRYSGISLVDLKNKTTRYYGLPDDNYLTMNLGANPFLQYGTNSFIEEECREILNNIAAVAYVPFHAMMLGDPAYDLGDVLIHENGVADGSKSYCIQRYVWTLNGGYDCEGVGKDPALANAKSKTDKQISGLLSNTEKNIIQYYFYTNSDEILIRDQETQRLLMIRFASLKETVVMFNAEVLLETYTDDTVGIVTYQINGGEDVQYHPTETWIDGQHIMHLMYHINIPGAELTRFVADLTALGGTIRIPANGVQAVVSGQGLAAIGSWDGYIDVEEEIAPIQLVTPSVYSNITDDVSTDIEIPCEPSGEDTVGVIQLNSMVVDDNMVEYAFVNKRMMSVYTHQQLQAFTHEDLNTGFIHG